MLNKVRLPVSSDEKAYVYEVARAAWGDDSQLLKCVEELNELGAVLAKLVNTKGPDRARLRHKLVDELADVRVVLDQAYRILGSGESHVGIQVTEADIEVQQSNKVRALALRLSIITEGQIKHPLTSEASQAQLRDVYSNLVSIA